MLRRLPIPDRRPSIPDHRRSIAIALLVLVVTTGCLGTVSMDTGPGNADTGTDSEPPTRDLPEPPAELTAETAASFAATYEEVHKHNDIIQTQAGVVDLGTKCGVDDVEGTNGQYRVTLDCGHWWEFQQGDNRGIADGAPYEVTYVVGADGVLSVSRSGP